MRITTSCTSVTQLLFLCLITHQLRNTQSSLLQLMAGIEALQCVQDLLGGHWLAPAGFPPGEQVHRIHAAR